MEPLITTGAVVVQIIIGFGAVLLTITIINQLLRKVIRSELSRRNDGESIRDQLDRVEQFVSDHSAVEDDMKARLERMDDRIDDIFQALIER